MQMDAAEIIVTMQNMRTIKYRLENFKLHNKNENAGTRIGMRIYTFPIIHSCDGHVLWNSVNAFIVET